MADSGGQQQATVITEVTQASRPTLPDYLMNPDAVLKDEAAWRFGKAPDYSNTRRVFTDTKKMNYADGSLEYMIQNLVKNWEIEASFKTNLADWRTIDRENYTFAINGGPPQDAEHMLKVGTYNAIIAPNSYYSSDYSDFSQSHKTFKRMMPTFAWEVLEVYVGPPRAVFKWRHWGQMKSDYVGHNEKGERITMKAHGGILDIQGVTVAIVNDRFQVKSLETFFDPLDMFRQFTSKDIKVDGETLNGEVLTNPHPVNERMAEQVESGPPIAMDEFDCSRPGKSYDMIQEQQETMIIDATACADESRARKPSVDVEQRSSNLDTELDVSDTCPGASTPPGHPGIALEGGGPDSCPFLPASYSLLVAQAHKDAPEDSAVPTHEVGEKMETATAGEIVISAPSEILLSTNMEGHAEPVSGAVEVDDMHAEVVAPPTQLKAHTEDLVCAASIISVDSGAFLLSEQPAVHINGAVSKADSASAPATFDPEVTFPDPLQDGHDTQHVAEGGDAFVDCHEDTGEPLETTQ